MSELARLLRLQVQGDKEFKITAVQVTGTRTVFTSQLTTGYERKKFYAYNNSESASGEVAWGASSGDTMLIPKGAIMEIPVSTDLSVYFSNTVSGELGDLRVLEIA